MQEREGSDMVSRGTEQTGHLLPYKGVEAQRRTGKDGEGTEAERRPPHKDRGEADRPNREDMQSNG